MPISNQPLLAPMVNKLAKRSELGPAEVEALLELPYRLAKVDSGTYLVRESDRVDNCIVLLSGFAFQSKIAGAGGRQILSIHLRGDLIDLQNSLLKEADHNVQALTAAAVAYIPHDAILGVAAAHPTVAHAFWRETLVDASVQREWLLNVGRRDAHQRVAHLLCGLALRQKEAGLCNGPDYEWPMTQEQIGDATGLTSVHVNRTVGRMRMEGLIKVNGRSITIKDWPNLQRAGDFSRNYLHQAAVTA